MNWISIIFILLVFVLPLLQKIVQAYSEWQEKSKASSRDDMEDADRSDYQQGDRAQASYGNDPTPQQMAEMTMAERIELARRRSAQQNAGSRDDLNQARMSRETQQRAQAEALQRQQEQAERQRQQQATARAQAQQRQAEETARRQQPQPRRQPRPTPVSPQNHARSTSARPVNRKQARSQTVRRQSDPEPIGHKPVSQSSIGKKRKPTRKRSPGRELIDGVSLKQAFILKELLDKPLALRNPETEQQA